MAISLDKLDVKDKTILLSKAISAQNFIVANHLIEVGAIITNEELTEILKSIHQKCLRGAFCFLST